VSVKILQISSSPNKPVRKTTLAEKLPFFMQKVIPGGSLHPLAEDLYSVVLLLYKGQEEKVTCSEKAMIKACSDLLNNGIAEWIDKDNFKHFSDLDEEILKEAIWRLLDMIETADELKSHLLFTHLKKAVREVCGGNYSQAVGTALTYIEAGLTKPGSIPQIVWNAARKFSPENRKIILRTATSEKDNGYAASGLQFCRRSTFGERVTEQCDDHLPIYPTSD
jgi:hypothetical protein